MLRRHLVEVRNLLRCAASTRARINRHARSPCQERALGQARARKQGLDRWATSSSRVRSGPSAVEMVMRRRTDLSRCWKSSFRSSSISILMGARASSPCRGAAGARTAIRPPRARGRTGTAESPPARVRERVLARAGTQHLLARTVLPLPSDTQSVRGDPTPMPWHRPWPRAQHAHARTHACTRTRARSELRRCAPPARAPRAKRTHGGPAGKLGGDVK